jgi:oligoendopeptidase F
MEEDSNMTETYTQTAWSLTDLFPTQDSPEMEAAFEAIQAQVSDFEGRRRELTPDIPTVEFMKFVESLESISQLVHKVYSFASLRFYGDTQDQAAQTFLARVDQFMADIENRILFFSLWWKGLEEEQAERLLEHAEKYHYFLKELRLFKPYTLSEPEEKVINIKNVTGAKAIEKLYETITNRYLFKVEIDGKQVELTRDELMVHARHHDPNIRAAIYQELYRVYGQDSLILGQIYQSLVRDWGNEQVNLRGFTAPISARNLANAVPDEVVDTLLKVCRSNADIFQRFFRLKARWLMMERLRRYDIYAPLAKSEKTYEYGDAAQMVLDSFRHFHPKIGDLAQRVFDENHLDSEVRKGKRGGAFCWSVEPGGTPWVLVNYQGRPGDVATIAHELGHAIHAMLAAHHTLFTFHSSLPLAENASTFGEMLVIDRLLAAEDDEEVRRDLLFRQVDDAYATIMRQAYFAIFERDAHEMIQKGVSVDELAQAYLENLREQFGDAVELSDEFKWEWVSIPHIYGTPFYVYAYAFGQLLVLALYKQFQEEGESFKPRYLEILSAGGSDAPAAILSRAGIDVYSRDFWQGGFDVIKDLIAQLEEIPIKSH